MFEFLGHIQWPFYTLLQSFLDAMETAYLFPGNFWYLYVNLPESAWLDFSYCLLEVRHPYFHLFDYLRSDLFLVQIYLWEIASKSLHCSLPYQG